MKLLGLVIVLVACGKGDKPSDPPPVTVRAPVEIDARVMTEEEQGAAARARIEKRAQEMGPPIPAPAADEPAETPREKGQQDLADALNYLFEKSGTGAIASIDENDLIFVTPKGDCDMKALKNFRKALVDLKLDPAQWFDNFMCNGGAMLKLH